MLKAYFKEIVLIFHKLSTGFVVEQSVNAILHKKQFCKLLTAVH